MTEVERTVRGLRWGAWGVAWVAIGWGLLHGVRPVLAYGLAQLAVLLLLRRYPTLSLRHAHTLRSMPSAAVEDADVRVRFEVRNAGRLPLFAPTVEDRFTPDKISRRQAMLFPSLRARQARQVSYVGRCFSKRGPYLVGPSALSARCPLGLYRATHGARDARALTVYPTVELLPGPPPLGASATALFGGLSRRDQGAGDVPLSVRDYRPGDPQRQIHWPTSARRGRLAILERERHVVQRLTVCLDSSLPALRGLGRQSTLELSVRIAAAVASQALDQGYRVGLAGCQEQDRPLGGGRAQLTRLLDSLALLRPAGDTPLSQVVRDQAHGFGAGQGVLLVVSELEDDLEPLLEVTADLVARRCLVTAVLLDPHAFPRLHAGTSPPLGLDTIASRFLSAGVVVYVVRPDESLALALATPYRGRRRLRLTQDDL